MFLVFESFDCFWIGGDWIKSNNDGFADNFDWKTFDWIFGLNKFGLLVLVVKTATFLVLLFLLLFDKKFESFGELLKNISFLGDGLIILRLLFGWLCGDIIENDEL